MFNYSIKAPPPPGGGRRGRGAQSVTHRPRVTFHCGVTSNQTSLCNIQAILCQGEYMATETKLLFYTT